MKRILTIGTVVLCIFLVFGLFFLKDKKEINSESVKNNELKIFYWGEIPKFHPVLVDHVHIWWLQNLVWERLVDVNKDSVWTPSIAKSWSYNEDKTKIFLSIDPDLQWSNGNKVTEKDFQFSFKFFELDWLKGGLYKAMLEKVKNVEFKGNILQLELDPKFSSDPIYASHLYWTQILRSARVIPSTLETNPFLGTGPYVVEKFSNLGRINLTKNNKSLFYKRNLNLKMPKSIVIRSVKSESLLREIVKNQNGLILGIDLFFIDDPGWFAVEDHDVLISIVFNIRKISRNDRIAFYKKITSINDLEKLNLKVRKFKSYGKDSAFYDLSKENNNLKVESKNNAELEIFYTNENDEKWLTYLNEKLKKTGLMLNYKLVTHSILNEKLISQKGYISIVDEHTTDDFYPSYGMFHSKGAYNYVGWNNSKLDHYLELMADISEKKQIELNNEKIKDVIKTEIYQLPIYSYQSSVLWTRNRCNPIQEQFQGLGLIYKAIICADNH